MSDDIDIVERLRLLAATYPLWDERNALRLIISDLTAEVDRLRAALVAIQSEAHTFGEGCACSDTYIQRLDRISEMAHNALTEEARCEQ